MGELAFRIVDGSLQERFFTMREKVQAYCGGFANGKTSAACIKALELSRDYPGSNGLMARSTYPKLNDTLRKEFLKWCPRHWIKSFPRSANGSNTCTLTNDTTINFRYVSQQGGGDGTASTSNLLSATYDWMIVDQMEDPEITEKDFDDLLGRLRGMTPYAGDDPTMPRTGPRWFIVTANPTRNWFYKKLIRPYQLYTQHGVIDDQLLCIRDAQSERPIVGDDGKPRLLINLVEGSTYENADNLSPDFIQTLESTYRGSMRERFLLGRWAAYEGLIYPTYDHVTHVITHNNIMAYLNELRRDDYQLNWIEGYDHGIAVPSCYGIACVDAWGNVFEVDGFYEKEMPIEEQVDRIRELRNLYNIDSNNAILADPSIFRRTSASRRTIGRSTADMFYDNGQGVRMIRGNSDILNGIIKVTGFLNITKMHMHPITGDYGAPHLYVADTLSWMQDEFATYMWSVNSKGDRDDRPRDKDDHAMDMIKYQLSRIPVPASRVVFAAPQKPSILKWNERDTPRRSATAHRHRA
jgi:hypothetical protein